MPGQREPIFHDRQFIVDQTPHMTSSAVFVDIPNAALTTVDLGSPASYSLLLAVLVAPSVAMTLAEFRILVDGSPLGANRMILLKTNSQDVGFTFLGLAEISGTKEIEVQWRTDKGTLTLGEFNVMIDGIPSVRILT